MKTLSFLFFLMISLFSHAQSMTKITANNKNFHYVGRYVPEGTAIRFGWSGFTIKAKFQGSVCKLMMKDEPTSGTSGNNHFKVIIDGKERDVLKLSSTKEVYTLAKGLGEGSHTLELVKRTEGSIGNCLFKGIGLASGKKLLPWTEKAALKIELIGNSITCGYGIEGEDEWCGFSDSTEDASKSFASIASQKLNAEASLVAYSGRGLVRNFAGDTKDPVIPQLYDFAFPHSPKDWDFGKWTPDLVVIHLGTNDFYMGSPERSAWVKAYVAFVQRIHKKYPKAKFVLLTGIMLSDDWSKDKALTNINSYVKETVQKLQAQGIACHHIQLTTMDPDRLGCDYHPNAEQQRINGLELAQKIKALGIIANK